ncbi:hypothetical protein D8I24_5496 (plasmid) [Cupriavidus necator H850]|nr:hypothetical protein D8I24_5496 [Cupriavidus necator H850]
MIRMRLQRLGYNMRCQSRSYGITCISDACFATDTEFCKLCESNQRGAARRDAMVR